MNNKMAVMPMKQLLLSMSIPLMLSLLVQSLYNIVDSIFVAKLSEQALTATSLVYAIQFLMIAVSVGTAVGLNALLSRRIGQKRYADACQGATTGLIIVLIIATVFALIGFFFSPRIAKALTGDPDLQLLCQQYMSICMIFCYGIFVQAYGQRLLQAVGDTVLSMFSLIIGAIINIILDPIMIFGLFGFPALGIVGAAVATVIGQWIGGAAALIFNRFANPYIHVTFKNYKFLWSDVRDIFKVGMPTIIMQAIGSAMTFVINAILIRFSTTAVAFFGVYYRLQSFLMMPMNGLGQAAIPIVGFNYGAKHYERIKEAWSIVIPTGFIFGLCGTIVFMLFPSQLLSLFSASEDMLSIGIIALRIISLTFPMATVTIICGYFASGLNNGVINMLSGAMRQLVILVPILYLLLNSLGINFAWLSFIIAEGLAFLYAYFATKHEMSSKLQ